MHAADKGHSETVDALVGHGAGVDMVTVDGWTASMFAAQKGWSEIIEVLLDGGSDV